MTCMMERFQNGCVVVFNTDYGSSEPLKTLVMLCYVMLYMRREILNAIRASIGSQCSCSSVGVMWSLGLRSFIRRAAVCSTEDKGCSVDEGRPDRTELQ